MPRRYKPAAGCSFSGSMFKNDMVRHLAKTAWCPCKSAGWTISRSLDASSVTRKSAVCPEASEPQSEPATSTVAAPATFADTAPVSSAVAAPGAGQHWYMPPAELSDELVGKGIYVGLPNGEWSSMRLAGAPLQGPGTSAVLKFGCSDNCVKRVTEHQRTYKGFKLLAWFSADDPRAAEAAVKAWLQVHSLLAHGVNSHKATMDTELVLVHNDGELEALKRCMARHAAGPPSHTKLRTLELELEILKLKAAHDE